MIKYIILILSLQTFAFGKTTKVSDLKFPLSIAEFKSKVKLNKPTTLPTVNQLELIFEKNFAYISDKKNILSWFEYKTEFNPENTTFIFINRSKIFDAKYRPAKKVFLKIGSITKENAVDKFLFSALFTMFNKMHIEVVNDQNAADEIVTIDASVVKMPANYMRRIYLLSTDKNQKNQWEVEITSPGKLDGIRRMIPSMILSSQNFIMKNENQKKLEITGVNVREFFYEIVAMNLGTKYSIINF